MKIIEYPSYAREKAKRLFRISGIAALGAVVCGTIAYGHLPARLFGGILAFFVIAFAAQVFTRAFNAWLGQSGEDRTSKTLSSLSDDYTLIRNLQVGEKQGDIDFVLLGPFGALVLEQKTNTVPMRCEGDNWSYQVKPTYWRRVKSYSRQLKRNVKAVQRLLKVPCYGAIVFNNHVELTVSEPTVEIILRKDLLKHIQALPAKNYSAEKLTTTLNAQTHQLAA